MGTASEKQRIDKWLFFARVVKSRSLAAKLAAGGHVRVNGQKLDQASYGVKLGDDLTITLERKILIYKVLLLGERRGPASDAQLLYQDNSPAMPDKDEMANIKPGLRDAGSGRPTKRERRLTDKLRQVFSD
ncbi:RNA-binding S4 domain-containing protein [Paenochrobactrum sp. BZR 588]|uniref:RNA-binding S4 domain-containing protein n=1 Tax=unclassified Paenochrobactrum TaxID=2639760 RepID=UPI00385422E6